MEGIKDGASYNEGHGKRSCYKLRIECCASTVPFLRASCLQSTQVY